MNFFILLGEYPAMSKVFVDERDTFLAYSLRQASEAPVQNGTGTKILLHIVNFTF